MAEVAPIINDNTQITHDMTQGLQTSKVHIRGVDNLTTDNIKAFALEHYPPEFERIEWIDDTSANIVYSSDSLASEALIALTDEVFQSTDTLEQVDIRPAKKLSLHPDSLLQVRIAIATDVKKPRARDASRFYLMNPEHDPSNRRRQYDGRDNRDNRRDGNRRYSNERSKRRRESDVKPFDENMYDDAPAPSAKAKAPFEESMYDDPPAPGSLAARITAPGRDQSDRRDDSRPRVKRVRSGDLMDDWGDRRGDGPRRGQDTRDRGEIERRGESGRLRDRSASPLQDGDGRFGFGGDEIRVVRQRSYSPRRNGPTNGYQRIPQGDIYEENGSMDGRFRKPDRASASSTRRPSQQDMRALSHPPTQVKELFPERLSAPGDQPTKELFPGGSSTPRNQAGKELFARKGSSSHHRRNAAMDSADGTNKDLFADRMNTAPEGRSVSRSTNDLFVDRLEAKKPDLFGDRLSTTKSTAASLAKADLFSNRLSGTQPAAAINGGVQLGFSIKGAANLASDQGFKIRGAAGLNNPRVKELFPDRGEGAKDLFSTRMKERKKADLFF